MADHDETLLQRWQRGEPVRLYAYGLLVPTLALLVGYGWLTTEQAGLWLAVGAAALLFSGIGVELARRSVDSPATVQRGLTAAYARGVANAVGRTPEQIADERQNPPV